MFRILFINPRYFIHHPPLGIGYLSAYVKKYAEFPVETMLYDETVDSNLAGIVQSFKPDVIGISVVTPAYERVRRITRELRDLTPAPIIAGGPHVTAMPESVLSADIDVVVMGEGEETLLELVRCLKANGNIKDTRIKGIAWEEDGHVTTTPARDLIENLDRIPPPDRALFKMREFYMQYGRLAGGLYGRGTSLIPSRGCPYSRCHFCSSHLMWRGIVRYSSPERIADEVQQIVDEYDANSVIFLDDNFTTSRKWLERLALLFRERGLDKHLKFDCESIAAFMDAKRAEILKEMGCIRVEFGFESGSSRILSILKRGRASVALNERAIAICKEFELDVLGNGIFGYLDETPEEFEESANWYRSQHMSYRAFHLYTPYPGTGGWQQALDLGLVNPETCNWEKFGMGGRGNIMLNRVFPAGELDRRFRALREEMMPRNISMVVDAGLSLAERSRLFVIAAKESTNLRATSGRRFSAGELKGLRAAAEVHFWAREGMRFLREDRQLWRLRNRFIPFVPLPKRTWYGAWMLCHNDACGGMTFLGQFENDSQAFVSRFLSPGMVFMDIGANQGNYTLLASSRVGESGRVIAFEPSPRELKRLRLHLWLNRCRNVQVEPIALGAALGDLDFFVCLDRETGCNSLRQPDVPDRIQTLRVPVRPLDDYISENRLERVDFLKIDVEGGELDVLRGADKLLHTGNRPLIMCELSDVRTRAWQYDCREIYRFLEDLGFTWFSFSRDGSLYECPLKKTFQENLLAVPREKVGLITSFLKE